MRLNFLFLLFGAVFFGWGSALADDVRIRTSFPSPYGTYTQMEVTGVTAGANDVTLATRGGNTRLAGGAGSRVAVGTANPEGGAQRTLGARDNAGVSPRLAFFHAPSGGAQFGVSADTFGTSGGLQAETGASAVRTLALNPFGGNVGVGITNPQYTLHVSGPVALNDGGGIGQIQLVYNAGGYDHVYAP